MKGKVVFTLLTTLLSLLLFPAHSSPRAQPDKQLQWAKEKVWVKERMKFHGIERCVKEGGKYYFTRNGKRIRL